MVVKCVLATLVFIYVKQLEGKAVEQKKVEAYPGSSYSMVIQASKQRDPERNDMHWYNTFKTSKNDQQSYALSSKLDENTEKSNTNHYSDTNDLKRYDNLELMFDSEYVLKDLKNQRPNSVHKSKLISNVPNSKQSSSLESDQVFLQHEQNKMSKYDRKSKHKSKIYVGTMNSEVNTDSHKANLQSTMTAKPVVMERLDPELFSSNLTLGSIPFELIHDLNESLETNQNNPVEDKSFIFDLSKIVDLNLESKRTLVSSNFASNLKENEFSKDNFDVVENIEDKKLFHREIGQMFEGNFDSFVFNPSAQPLEKFQECKTPRNESGFCRYVQHCMLPSILNSIQHFMENVCVIQQRFIGVCCPEFPVQRVLVKWEGQSENFSRNDSVVETPQGCGIATNTRIVGGNNADRKAWPWMVALLNSKKKFFCGGSLINNQYVLTAAHCTFGTSKNQIVARLGEYDFNAPRDPHDDYRVAEIKRHGQYNSMTLRNDIALLKLEKPVVFNEFVKVICLPKIAKDFIGNLTTLVGWGHLNGGSGGTSDILQEASFPVISNGQCSTAHGMPIPSSLICAAAVSRDKGACNGDSGGPLMLLDENDSWEVIGIVSWGRRGCNPKFPTVYTRVTHFMSWIRKHSM